MTRRSDLTAQMQGNVHEVAGAMVQRFGRTYRRRRIKDSRFFQKAV